MKWLPTCLVVLLVSLGAFAPAAHGQSNEYVVGPRDVIAVTVSNEPTLSGKFTVVAPKGPGRPDAGTVDVKVGQATPQ